MRSEQGRRDVSAEEWPWIGVGEAADWPNLWETKTVRELEEREPIAHNVYKNKSRLNRNSLPSRQLNHLVA